MTTNSCHKLISLENKIKTWKPHTHTHTQNLKVNIYIIHICEKNIEFFKKLVSILKWGLKLWIGQNGKHRVRF